MVKEYKAFCMSRKCCDRMTNFIGAKVLKQVPRGTLNCRECGQILVWRSINYQRRAEKEDRKTNFGLDDAYRP